MSGMAGGLGAASCAPGSRLIRYWFRRVRSPSRRKWHDAVGLEHHAGPASMNIAIAANIARILQTPITSSLPSFRSNLDVHSESYARGIAPIRCMRTTASSTCNAQDPSRTMSAIFESNMLAA